MREDSELEGMLAWTGGGVWDPGEALARLLLSAPWAERVRGSRVLELGCGTDVVGVAAALSGALAVTPTDCVVLLPQWNLRTNLPDDDERSCHCTHRFRWGDAAQLATLRANRSETFDFIVTADTLYQEGGVGCLPRCSPRPSTRCPVSFMQNTQTLRQKLKTDDFV